MSDDYWFFEPNYQKYLKSGPEPSSVCIGSTMFHMGAECKGATERSACREPECAVHHGGSGVSVEMRQRHSQAVTRAPGDRLASLMGRLRAANGTVGKRFRLWYEDDGAYLLGAKRDVVYVPWKKRPASAHGELYVLLGDPLPDKIDGIGLSSRDEYSFHRNWECVYRSAPELFGAGPWWEYIGKTLTPEVTAAVVASEAETARAAENDRREAYDREEARLASWSARHGVGL